MRIIGLSILFGIITFSCTQQKKPVSNIQHSEKYVRGEEAFPRVISSSDTLKIGEPIQATAVLNNSMYEQLADHEGFELTYQYFINNRFYWAGNRGNEIKVSDTITFEVLLDTLELPTNQSHSWQFTAVVHFKGPNNFKYDTTAIFEHAVYLTE